MIESNLFIRVLIHVGNTDRSFDEARLITNPGISIDGIKLIFLCSLKILDPWRLADNRKALVP